jgi:cobalt-precorrin-5B (C1)-methyltransferase
VKTILKLRWGYTTGTHASAVFIASVYEYLTSKVVDTLEIKLPMEKKATIEVKHIKKYLFKTIKVDNDDMDVTKGASIWCKLSTTYPKGLKKQTPSLLKVANSKVYVWAGEGVGVVTKDGLKIKPNHPAINPVPLEMMEQNTKDLLKDTNITLHAIFGVEDGINIAKQTANAKVGVVGGISILGTRGIVKPISSTAYIQSIKTEINVASKNSNTIVFTLGNSAFDIAKTLYDEVSIVEVGNFVYDSFSLLKDYDFKKIVFISSSAKMSKVAQGFKNTHNRFGSIDFDKIREWLGELNYTYTKETLTLKKILDEMQDDIQKEFLYLLTKKASKQIESWLDESNTNYKELEIIDTNIVIKKG